MVKVRTNITLPPELLELVDKVAGPRGRSAYIAEVVARQARRDEVARVFRETRGAAAGETGWGATDAERLRNLRSVREDGWERGTREEADAVPARHDGADRPEPRPSRRRGAPRVPLR